MLFISMFADNLFASTLLSAIVSVTPAENLDYQLSIELPSCWHSLQFDHHSGDVGRGRQQDKEPENRWDRGDDVLLQNGV